MTTIQTVIGRMKGLSAALPNQDTREAILRRQDGRCFDCGQPLGRAIIWGHFVPRCRGGGHGAGNRIALHPECERPRGDRMPRRDEVERLAKMTGNTSD